MFCVNCGDGLCYIHSYYGFVCEMERYACKKCNITYTYNCGFDKMSFTFENCFFVYSYSSNITEIYFRNKTPIRLPFLLDKPIKNIKTVVNFQ